MTIKEATKAFISLFKPYKIPENIEVICPHCHYPLLDRADFFDVDIVDEMWHPDARSICSNPNCARQFMFTSGASYKTQR